MMRRRFAAWVWMLTTLTLAGFAAAQSTAPGMMSGVVSGQLRVWHPVTVDFFGPSSSESTRSPSPFLDYRLEVTFTAPSGKWVQVPGFFDGDGQGNGTGNVWRVRFMPDEPGRWRYDAHFRTGRNVAIETRDDVGTPTSFDGASGVFDVAPRDPNAPGFLRWGELEYIGEHYLKFHDGPYFLKGGADSPENLLGYAGFDNTPNAKNRYAAHERDWRAGDPDWDSPDRAGAHDGRAIIGMLNYLASQRVNSVYFLPMNIGGDARDTWPYVGPVDRLGSPSNDNLRFDISKLHQWEIVFAHAQRKGILLHFVLGEAEAKNKLELDNAQLGIERKLYYREMVARFAHHPAIQWNITEEYNLALDLGVDRVTQFAAYVRMVDPYDHPITVHNAFRPERGWGPFFGNPLMDLTSIQGFRQADDWAETIGGLRALSAEAGRPIPIHIDEPQSITAIEGGFDDVRKRMLWDIYLGGSGGVEWYNGAQDQGIDDFRDFEQVWHETAIARHFLQDHVPYWNSVPARELVRNETPTWGGAEVLAQAGVVYTVYYPCGLATGEIDLRGEPGVYTLRWFNPREGQFQGASHTLLGDRWSPVGTPPSEPDEDWVAYIRLQGDPGTPPPPPSVDCNNNGIEDAADIASGASRDCNNNGVPDECDIDANGNGIPDDCEADETSGLTATYFDGPNFTGRSVTRSDPAIDFDWGFGAPVAGFGADSFSVRWDGLLTTPEGLGGTYRFSVLADDGIRVWIDGELVLNEWRDQRRTFTFDLPLEGGRSYPLRVELFENGRLASVRLAWDPPGPQPLATVPASALSQSLGQTPPDLPDVPDPGPTPEPQPDPAPDPTPEPTPDPTPPTMPDPTPDPEPAPDPTPDPDLPPISGETGMLATYFDNAELRGPGVVRVDPTINFNWANGGPPVLGKADNFSVRWAGLLSPIATGPHIISVIADDGVRLWLDGTLLIDRWQRRPGQWTAQVTLQEGRRYPLVVEYFETTGGATARVLWDPPGPTPMQPIPTESLTPSLDRNGNGVADPTDIARGDSVDCNADGIPDEVQFGRLGLRGEYFDGPNFSGSMRVRTDASIDFDWGDDSPIEGMATDTFSTRWQGYLRTPDAGGVYRFVIDANDGVRVWVAGERLVNAWYDHFGRHEAEIILEANRQYPIVIEHYEGVNTAQLRIMWDPPGDRPLVVIPQMFLSTNTWSPCGVHVAEGCVADIAEPFGVLDEADAVLFVQAAAIEDPLADLDGNGRVDVADATLFSRLVETGCGSTTGE